MSAVINVGIADLKTAKAPDLLLTVGLGSCIGICIHDPILKVGGMAHIMLPTAVGTPGGNPLKYADTAMTLLLKKIVLLGAVKFRLRAKIAGGAQMFTFPGKLEVLRVGERNAEMVRRELTKYRIPLLAADVGGGFGRTIYFDVGTGALRIRTISRGEKVI